MTIERARRNGGWRALGAARADARGGYRLRVRPRRLARRYRFRAPVAGAPLACGRVRSRDVTFDTVGDINLGDGVADVMGVRGFRYLWSGVARELRSVDVAFGNLECAVSTRGRKVPNKEYNFRGRPAALREVSRYAGMDVLNLANNHAGDFGTTALLDTIRWIRRVGMKEVGAGARLAAARRPRVLPRLGLRRRVVAYSLGNFVWSAGSGQTSRTGILRLRLSARGVEASRFLPARISPTHPALVRR